MIRDFKGGENKLIPILIINKSYLSEENKAKLLKAEVIVLDVKNIKKMHKGRDMVAEIIRENEALKIYY